jgi:hypothetical protein
VSNVQGVQMHNVSREQRVMTSSGTAELWDIWAHYTLDFFFCLFLPGDYGHVNITAYTVHLHFSMTSVDLIIALFR